MRRLMGLGLLAVSLFVTNACRSSNAAPNNLQPCRIVLAQHQGDEKLDREIRQLQQKISNSQQPLPLIEQLGWRYVEKARTSFDPGFYKLAEQCATCLEAKQAARPKENGATQSIRPAVLLLRGHVLHNLHRFKEAEPLARELSEKRGLAYDHALLGDVLLEQGRLDEAAAAYQKMMGLKPGLQAYIRAAQLRWLKGDLDNALKIARLAVRASSPNDPEAAAWVATKLALYSLQANDLAQAREACEETLQQLPNYAPALLARGRVLLAEGRTAAALPSLQQAAKLNPLPEYQWALADALRAEGRTDEAQQVETELKAKGASEDQRTLALYLATRGENIEQAVRLTAEELKVRQDIFTLDAAAFALAKAGQTAEAWSLMQKALAEGTRDARLHFHAALIALQANQTQNARQYFKQAQMEQQTLLPSEQAQLRQLKF